LADFLPFKILQLLFATPIVDLVLGLIYTLPAFCKYNVCKTQYISLQKFNTNQFNTQFIIVPCSIELAAISLQNLQFIAATCNVADEKQ